MTAREFAEWAQFHRQNFGFDPESDYRAAMLASVTANVGGAKKQGGGQFQPSDFMPQPKKKTGSVLGFLKDTFGDRVRPKHAPKLQDQGRGPSEPGASGYGAQSSASDCGQRGQGGGA